LNISTEEEIRIE